MKFKKIVSLALVCSLISQPLASLAASDTEDIILEAQKSPRSEQNHKNFNELENLEKCFLEIDNGSLKTKSEELKKLEEEVQKEDRLLNSKIEKFNNLKEKIENKNNALKEKIKKLKKIKSEFDFENNLRESNIEDLENQSKKLEKSVKDIDGLLNYVPLISVTQASLLKGILDFVTLCTLLSAPFIALFVVQPFFSTLANRSFDALVSYFNSTKV